MPTANELTAGVQRACFSHKAWEIRDPSQPRVNYFKGHTQEGVDEGEKEKECLQVQAVFPAKVTTGCCVTPLSHWF